MLNPICSMCQDKFCFQAMAVLLGIIYLGQGYDDGNQDGVMNINGCLFLMIMNQTFTNMLPVLNVSSVIGM